MMNFPDGFLTVKRVSNFLVCVLCFTCFEVASSDAVTPVRNSGRPAWSPAAFAGALPQWVTSRGAGQMRRQEGSTCPSTCLVDSTLLPTSRVDLRAKKSKGGARKNNQKATVPKRKESEVVQDVMEAAKEAGTGFDTDPQSAERLVTLLEELEGYNEISNPARSASLWGKWRLLFTNSPPMIKNKGVTGLGSLPFVGFEELTQEFKSDGSAETVEILKMPPFGTPARSTLRGSLTAASPEVIEQTYVDVQLASVFKSQADNVSSDNYFSKAVLAITYLSDALRVCRSPSGAVFLFQRSQFSR